MTSLNPCTFHSGQCFSSYQELVDFKIDFEKQNFTQLIIKKCTKLTPTTDNNLCASPYKQILYTCQHHGSTLSRSIIGLRKRRSIKQICPFFVRIRLTQTGQLQVDKLCLKHNHPFLESTHKYLPLRKRFSGELRSTIKRFLTHDGGGSKQLVLQIMKDVSGDDFSMEDLLNWQMKMEKPDKFPSQSEFVSEKTQNERKKKSFYVFHDLTMCLMNASEKSFTRQITFLEKLAWKWRQEAAAALGPKNLTAADISSCASPASTAPSSSVSASLEDSTSNASVQGVSSGQKKRGRPKKIHSPQHHHHHHHSMASPQEKKMKLNTNPIQEPRKKKFAIVHFASEESCPSVNMF